MERRELFKIIAASAVAAPPPGQEHVQAAVTTSKARNEGQPANELERFFSTLKPAVIDGYRYSEAGVKRFMRWEGNHYEVNTWKGACNQPEHQA